MSDFATDAMELKTAVERRGEQRRKALKGGHIAFNGGYSAYECTVKDVSAHGARLSFGDMAAVPHEFALTIRGEGKSRPARLVWRHRGMVGVAIG